MDQSVVELVKKRINTHGELHLDAVFTEILINWLKTIEDNHKFQLSLLPELEQILTILRE
jgi:hypothetical protein